MKVSLVILGKCMLILNLYYDGLKIVLLFVLK